MSYKNNVALVNAGDNFIITLDKENQSTVALTTDPTNPAGAVIRLDATYGEDQNGAPIWKTGISLSDPSAAAGAAFLANLTGPSLVGFTQDRLYGAEQIRIIRTDATVGNAFVSVSERVSG